MFYVGPPQNVTIEVINNELVLRWREPKRGLTNSQVLSYIAECSMLSRNAMYSSKATTDGSTHQIQLHAPVQLQSVETNTPVMYKCCVEAKFESYSSIACNSMR